MLFIKPQTPFNKVFFLIFSFLLTLFSMQSVFAGTPDAFEEDGHYSVSSTMTAGVPQHHTLHTAVDEDWIEFTLTSASDIVLQTSGATGGLKIGLYGETSGTFLGSVTTASMQKFGLLPGTYHVKVEDDGNDNENPGYDIELTATDIPGDNYERDNVKIHAKEINLGETQLRSILDYENPTGVMNPDKDWIKFTLNSTEDLKVEVSGLTGNLRIELVDDNNGFIASATATPAVAAQVLIDNTLNAGIYYLIVEENGQDAEISEYNIVLKVTDQFEPDNTPAQASDLIRGVSQNHSIDPATDKDYMKITLAATDDIEIITSGETDGLKIGLYTYDGTTTHLIFGTSSSGTSTSSPTIQKTGLAAGTYYVIVQDNGNDNIIQAYNILYKLPPGQGGDASTIIPIIQLLLLEE